MPRRNVKKVFGDRFQGIIIHQHNVDVTNVGIIFIFRQSKRPDPNRIPLFYENLADNSTVLSRNILVHRTRHERISYFGIYTLYVTPNPPGSPVANAWTSFSHAYLPLLEVAKTGVVAKPVGPLGPIFARPV